MKQQISMPIYARWDDVPAGLQTRNQWDRQGRRVRVRRRDAKAKVWWNDWRVHLYSIDQTERIAVKNSDPSARPLATGQDR